MHLFANHATLAYRLGMNERFNEAPQEDREQKSHWKKIGYIATVVGLAVGAAYAVKEADIAPLAIFGDAIDLGPHLDVDKGDAVLGVK